MTAALEFPVRGTRVEVFMYMDPSMQQVFSSLVDVRHRLSILNNSVFFTSYRIVQARLDFVLDIYTRHYRAALRKRLPVGRPLPKM